MREFLSFEIRVFGDGFDVFGIFYLLFEWDSDINVDIRM